MFNLGIIIEIDKTRVNGLCLGVAEEGRNLKTLGIVYKFVK